MGRRCCKGGAGAKSQMVGEKIKDRLAKVLRIFTNEFIAKPTSRELEKKNI